MRISESEMQRRRVVLAPDEITMIRNLLDTASYMDLSRREAAVLVNAIDGGIAFNDRSAEQALADAVAQLEALSLEG